MTNHLQNGCFLYHTEMFCRCFFLAREDSGGFPLTMWNLNPGSYLATFLAFQDPWVVHRFESAKHRFTPRRKSRGHGTDRCSDSQLGWTWVKVLAGWWEVFGRCFLFFFEGLQIQKDTLIQRNVSNNWRSSHVGHDCPWFIFDWNMSDMKNSFCVGFLHLAHKCRTAMGVVHLWQVSNSDFQFLVQIVGEPERWFAPLALVVAWDPWNLGGNWVEVMFACEMVVSFRNTWIDKILGLVHCTFKVCVIRINIDCQETLFCFFLG